MAPSAVGNSSVSSPLARHAALALLFAISLCQYVDRWSVAAVLNELQAPPATDGSLDGGFGLSDTAAGLVSSVFVVAYMVLSPVFGYFGDRRPRIPLIFFGSVLYAASVFCGSYARYYYQFLFFRSLVGVGEASFSVLAPTLIADWYPAGPERTTALGIFCVSLPLGAASGFIYAGEVSRLMGWRYAFRLSPFLSFALSSMLLLTVAEPDRGGCDRGGASTSRGGSATKNVWSTDVVAILSSRAFTLSTLGAIGMTFTSGALAQWAPAFLQRVNCVTADEDCAASVTRTFGIVSGITGVVGTLGGAQVSKWYSKRNDAADAVVCAMGLILATPCVYAAIYLAPVSPGYPTWSAVFLGEMLVSMVWAPNTAILLSVVTPERRSNATSIYLLLTHLFGDSMSPTLIGLGADFLRTSSFFNMDKVASLQHALYLSVFSTFIASGLYMAAGTYLAPDRAKVSASTYRRLDSDAFENEGTAVENVPAPRRVYTLGPEDSKDGSSPEFEVAGD